MTLNDTEPSSSLIATRLAAKSIITDLQTEDYRSPSSQQARFIEQEQADKNQELIDLSIQHQILSPHTAFIAVETRTDEEKTSSEKITLCEVPIETRAYENYSPTSPSYSVYSPSSVMNSPLQTRAYEQYLSLSPSYLIYSPSLVSKSPLQTRAYEQYVSINPSYPIDSPSSAERKHRSHIVREPERSRRLRSRSRSPRHHESSSLSTEKSSNEDANPSDPIREIISLQNFGGLWEINHLDQLISYLQRNSAWENVDLKKICQDHSNKDQNVVLSMVMMFILMKYFSNDEALWKPIIKKSIKAMKSQLAQTEYDELYAEIQALI